MGVKNLYTEVGAGEKIALAKLSANHYTAEERQFRVAIDASIWSFQSQNFQARNNGGGGVGKNSDLRTLYYRMTNLLRLNIQAVFIFDGQQRPDFKRDKKISKREGRNLSLFKDLVSCFGFPNYIAPGEAEAECAHLQKRGIVDAVWSEDVDTLLFGGKMILKKCPKENDKSTPTHVIVHRSETIESEQRLTRQGMILIALLRGGDYDTLGVANCGIAYAAGAARHGYGEDLIRACRQNGNEGEEALNKWRERLNESIKTNSEGLFKARSNKINIPETFPNREILGYYTNPKVSSPVPKLIWGCAPDVQGIREYTLKHFGWSGTGKFIATFAPAYLSFLLATKADSAEELVHEVASSRTHKSTDNLQEYRIKYRPVDVVKMSFDPESEPSPKGSELISSQQVEVSDDEDEGEGEDTEVVPGDIGTNRKESIYDPREVQSMWILREWVQIGALYKVKRWENAKIAKDNAKLDKQQQQQSVKKGGRKTKLPTQSNVITNYYNTSKTDVLEAVHQNTIHSKTKSPSKIVSTPKVQRQPAKQAPRSPPKPRTKLQDFPSSSIKNTLKASKASGGTPSKSTVNIAKVVTNTSKITKYQRVVLRESLEGSWKPEVAGAQPGYPGKAFENVEVLDLLE